MLIAHYIGNHRHDSLTVRLGWAVTRLAQKGAFDRATHTEAILRQCPDGRVLLGSSTLRPEAAGGRAGVRTKFSKLTPGNWLIHDVPQWDADKSLRWFVDHDGEPYDVRGALAAVLPGHGSKTRRYCTEAVAESVGFADAGQWSPAEWAAITASIGRDVTAEFFKGALHG